MWCQRCRPVKGCPVPSQVIDCRCVGDGDLNAWVFGTDRRRQPERILQILAEVDADIVALQEVDRRFGTRVSTLSAEAIVDHSDYLPVRFGIRQESLGWHGNVILVRKGI